MTFSALYINLVSIGGAQQVISDISCQWWYNLNGVVRHKQNGQIPNNSLSKEANACHVLSFKILITSLVKP
jgi:hypothetical protein